MKPPSKPKRLADSRTESITDAISSVSAASTSTSSSSSISSSSSLSSHRASTNQKHPPPPPPKPKSSSTISSLSSNASSSLPSNNQNIPSEQQRSISAAGTTDQTDEPNPNPNSWPLQISSSSSSSTANYGPIDQKDLEMIKLEVSSGNSSQNNSNSIDPLNKPRYERIFDPTNKIFHKFRFAPAWLVISILFHCGQFAILLSIGYNIMSSAGIFICLVLALIVLFLLIYAKFQVNVQRTNLINMHRRKIFEPEDEQDDISDNAIFALAIAGFLEGTLFAIFACLTAGNEHSLDGAGYYSRNTLLQTLRFASVNLLAFHRIIRPANRADPMRTMFELEVLGVCWDALDGSTLWELASVGSGISTTMVTLIKILMVFWYVSVGLRISCMFLTSLPPESKIFQYILSLPLALSPQPTVDRTMQGLILRSFITILMSFSELCAAILRLVLWSRGQLSSMQQDMCFKNILFLTSIQNAINFKINASLRNWNSRELGFGLYLPGRMTQIEIFRWSFAFFYCLQGAMMSFILIQVTGARLKWLANIGFDVVLTAIFLIYCKSVHVQNSEIPPQFLLVPAKGFHIFPWNFSGILTTVMFLNLFIARVPLIYYSFDTLSEAVTHSKLWTYNDALLVVNLSVITFILGSSFWSVSYMMFRKEFTACPGNYNAIHDPTISMVTSQALVEGSLDILSCTSFMQLASANLSQSMQGFIALFMILELMNAFQSFAFQIVLSGGHDDTPMDLVKWHSKLRLFRFLIDFGALILRIVLWREYNVISSVFLIKNLYNLMHAFSQIERSYGVEKYPPGTLFCEFVTPKEWYGMSLEEWRVATKSTLAAQARAGRRV